MKESLLNEWAIHNAGYTFYSALNNFKDCSSQIQSAMHADFNNNDEDKYFYDYFNYKYYG